MELKGAGVLPRERITELITERSIQNAVMSAVNPASLDCTLSNEAHRIKGFRRPRRGQSVKTLLSELGATEQPVTGIFERGVTYLVRLNEYLKLPHGLYGYCNPKSSTGRLDIHVRMIADGVADYGTIPPGYEGELWLAVVSRSFPVIMAPGFALAQVRFFNGDTRLNEQGLQLLMRGWSPLWAHGLNTPIPYEGLENTERDGSLTLTLDMHSTPLGFEAIPSNEPLDITKRDHYNPNDYFARVEKHHGGLLLKPDAFYILSTAERVYVPSLFAAELRPMDMRSGDFRAHYAGFIDPGWGAPSDAAQAQGIKNGAGWPLTLEVRPFEPLLIGGAGQPVAKLRYESMAEEPKDLYGPASGSTFTGQSGPRLGKQFKQ